MGFAAGMTARLTRARSGRGRASLRTATAGALVLGALAAGSLAAPTAPAVAAVAGVTAPKAGGAEVVTRRVTFTLDNSNESALPCLADGELHEVRGRLVGPAGQLTGSTLHRVNVLVHDVSTGGWFWNLRRHPAFDYAGNLARRGEVSLVLDRLGHGRSPLADGTGTCLGAQAQMLHELVQHLYSGKYAAADGHAPAATHVVLHGHSAGAAIAQLTASIDRDVEGLVLMSWSDLAPSTTALTEAATQTATCLTGGETFGDREHYALFGGTDAAYRKLLFASAPAAVQRAATARRTPTPCGDALSLAGLLTSGNLAKLRVDVPVLLLFGGKDALLGGAAAALQPGSYAPSADVTTRTFPGAGSALPLEKQAPKVRRAVVRWLRSTPELAE
ncbi:alpha/beta hydrolase [Nocardioides ferulae]|uniref:alpha/beta hydrolase n=1 Tax=Nocardioides ferulae TaxID=2340821 RepID=UPI000EB0DA9B|nr:alpha/beta fold hydrolase [Nocardioides ferulae]